MNSPILPKAWILAELVASEDAAAREVIELVSVLDDASDLSAIRDAVNGGALSATAQTLAVELIAGFERNQGHLDVGGEEAADFELARAVRDVRLVLSYAVTEGIELDDDIVSRLVEQCRLIEANQHNREIETQFWLASAQLHKKVAPITAARVRRYRSRWTPGLISRLFSRKPLQATGSSTWLFAVSLAFTIVLTVVGHLYLHVLEHSTVSVRSDLERLARLQNSVQSADSGAEAVVTLTDGSVFLREEYSTALECDLTRRWSSQLAVADRLLSEPWSVFRSKEPDDNAACGCACAEPVVKSGGWNDVSLPDSKSTISRSLSIQKLMLYPLLPFLYATMGTLIFILRAISGEISKLDYSRARMTQYSLRLPMGIVAGVTIGYLFTPDTLTGLGSLTPLGVAFVAGYSVELLFNVIDRIIGAFVDNSNDAVPVADKPLKPPSQ